MFTNQSWAPLSLINRDILPPTTWHSSQLSRDIQLWQPKICCTVRKPDTTSECLRCLRYDLLQRRRTMIPVPQTSETNKTFDGYVESEIILPIVTLLSGLRQNSRYPVLKYQLTLNPDDSDWLTTTEVRFFGDFDPDVLKFPVIFFFGADDGQFLLPMSASLERALHSLHRLSERNKIIITDFRTTVLINHVDEKLTTVDCEVAPSPSAVPLRYLLASYIQQPLPSDYFDLDTEDYVFTRGAPNNPRCPLPADEEIFATRRAHSDFDRYALVNSRWKAAMQARPKPVLVGTVLQAKSNGFQQRKPFQPRYPVEPLPEDTLAYLRAVARHTFPQFSQLLNLSQTFSLLLDEELTQSEGTAYARTFSCHIVTVDGQLISDDAPKTLCVKLFDDSAAVILSHEESPLIAWSQTFYTAEDMIHNEINVYNRVEFAWGSVVPQFYGAHSFTLQDGRTLFGILLEYVTPSEMKLEEQPEVAQIAFIQSARHALRVLQYADISQLDWSIDQWICTHSPSPTASDLTLTCVLIDFSLTAQGDCHKDGRKEDDYGGLADRLHEAGIPTDLIRKWFGPREEWDFFGQCHTARMEEYELLHNRPIERERSSCSSVPFDSDVANRIGVLVDTIGVPVKAIDNDAIGRVVVLEVLVNPCLTRRRSRRSGTSPESRFRACFLAFSWCRPGRMFKRRASVT
ncbi:hypothetical protein M405DRAFT_879263 [Rhizopogon salebrosus TDB-379]|nr:hypothetical protein M405DRAFT_879263 [Rhizopogon salebrosus TDB-379]